MARLPYGTGSKPVWITAGGLTAVFVITLAVAWSFVDPAPPAGVVIATGIEGGFYDRLGRKYAEALEQAGVAVELRPSRGSPDNLAALAKGEADFAFLQGGAGRAMQEEGIRSIAAVGLEPIWIFTRGPAPLTRLEQLAGRTLAAGPEGSGTRLMARTLLEAAGQDAHVRISPLAGEAAERALLAGEVDAALFVTAAETPAVARLLRRGDVTLAGLARAEAFRRAMPWLSVIDLPEGALDLKANVPSRPARVLAAVTSLAMRDEVHPALTALMLDAAQRIHASEIVHGEQGRFPSAAHTDFPLSDEARRWFEHGPSFLRRWLPFWAANMVDRLWVLLIPLATVMVPLLRAAPPVYRWQVRRRIYRWYRTLKDIEFTWWADESPPTRERLLRETDDLQAEVGRIAVPLSYADEVYRLRMHILLVEQLIREGRRPVPVMTGALRTGAASRRRPGPEEAREKPVTSAS